MYINVEGKSISCQKSLKVEAIMNLLPALVLVASVAVYIVSVQNDKTIQFYELIVSYNSNLILNSFRDSR